MRGYLKSSIDINDFNKALVKAAKNTTYTEEQLAKIDRDTDFLYQLIMLKRSTRKQNNALHYQVSVFHTLFYN